jgi:hypothetical protein
VVRTILLLLPVAFILAGGAQSFEHGGAGGGAQPKSAAGDGEIRTSLDAGLDESRYWRLENDPIGFVDVVAPACGAGDVFGCGLLFASRVLRALLHFCERYFTFSLIALYLAWLIWTSLRKAIGKLFEKAKRVARDGHFRR